MPFRPLRPVTARWRPIEGDGLQQVTVSPTRDGLRAEGVIVGGAADRAHGVRFIIACDAEWKTRGLDLETLDGRGLHLRSDGEGAWRDPTGARLDAFDGCLDVDLEGTPFTNTLPIRRTALTAAAGRLALRMLYVPFDTFEPNVDRQIYRCIADASHYGYEAADGSFAAEITVDEDGLVVDYPPLFHRVPV
jgi:hypothetical protein